MSSAIQYVLAVDGGGTHSRLALAGAGERVIVESGPTNATTDFDSSVKHLLEGLEALANKASISKSQLIEMPVFIGLAGVKTPEIESRLAHALPFQNAIFAEDRLAAVRGALGQTNGMLVHCGTGSFFAHQNLGGLRFAGGWGSVLGDEASSQWVGRKALARALLFSDGFAPHSELVDQLVNQFSSTDGILTFARDASPDAFGALAPMVTELANNGDVNAQHVLTLAANYISDGLERMGWLNGTPICLSGGIAGHCKSYLPDEKKLHCMEPNTTPLEGAIQLAFEHANRHQ